MKHYMFTVIEDGSELEGESFLVGAETVEQAWAIAQSEFPDEELEYDGKLSNIEAEMSGLDEF